MAYSDSTPNSDIYQRITDRIVAAIEADGGAGKWRMPWNKGSASIMMSDDIVDNPQHANISRICGVPKTLCAALVLTRGFLRLS